MNLLLLCRWNVFNNCFVSDLDEDIVLREHQDCINLNATETYLGPECPGQHQTTATGSPQQSEECKFNSDNCETAHPEQVIYYSDDSSDNYEHDSDIDTFNCGNSTHGDGDDNESELDHTREGESDSQTSGDSSDQTLGNDPEIVQRKQFHFPDQTSQLQHSQTTTFTFSDEDIVALTNILLHQDSLDYFEVIYSFNLNPQLYF